MSRWEPNARDRLLGAAMDLLRERGFDETTVAEIAARAGLTERTFFRYFADKREVLFWGAAALQASLVEGLARAPEKAAPLDAVAASFLSVVPMFEQRRDFARQRHAIIAAHPELQERELIKLFTLAAALAEALRRRGVPDPAATLTAEAGVAIFKVGFEQWVLDVRGRDLAHHLRASLGELRAITADGGTRGVRHGVRPSPRRVSPASRPAPGKARRAPRSKG